MPPRPGPDTDDVDDDGRQFGAGDVGKAFLLQADARAGTGGHGPGAGSSRAVNHVDGRDFALGLDNRAADLDHPFGHVMHDFSLRRDRIAEIMAAAGPDRRFGNGFIALHQNSVAHCFSSYRQTSMTLSGQMVAQIVHPVHWSIWSTPAG